MSPIQVTATVKNRTVPLEQVGDPRLAAALRGAAAEVRRKLEVIACPVHGGTATHVRLHFDARGGADLQYDSCCEQLGKKVRAALG